MEIFNNLWSLLITQNKFIADLLTTPFTFIETYIATNLFLTLLNINCSNKNKIIYVVLASLTTIISSFCILNPFNVFINYIIYFILIIFVFKMSFFKTSISLVSSMAFFGLISTLILNPYITLFNISAEQLSTIPIYYIGYLTCLYSIGYFLLSILRIVRFQVNLFEDIDKRNKKIILANFIFGFITLMLQAYITFYYIDNLPILITFLSFISLLAYFSISLYSLTRVMKLSLTTKKLESAEEYNKSLHILHDNVRGFKHDFDNIVTTIGGYIRTEDMEGLKNYYLQLEDDCQKVNNLYLLNPEVINNPRYI